MAKEAKIYKKEKSVYNNGEGKVDRHIKNNKIGIFHCTICKKLIQNDLKTEILDMTP